MWALTHSLFMSMQFNKRKRLCGMGRLACLNFLNLREAQKYWLKPLLIATRFPLRAVEIRYLRFHNSVLPIKSVIYLQAAALFLNGWKAKHCRVCRRYRDPALNQTGVQFRSEERRVGEECRSR